jgi:hypothetical protein
MRMGSTTKTGKKKENGTSLDECNIKYGIHFFSKHKDLLATALENLTVYTDKPIIKLNSLYGGKLSSVKTESTQVCFACRRLFNDTLIDESVKGGYSRVGKSRIYPAEAKWELHEKAGKCTAETRLKALHKFMVYESGSDILRNKLTEEQQVGLMPPVETRGRKRKEHSPVSPRVIETIRIIELPAFSPPPPVPPPALSTSLLPPSPPAEPSDEFKDLKRKLILAEIIEGSYKIFMETIQDNLAGDDTYNSYRLANRAVLKYKENELKAWIEEGLLEDTIQNRLALEKNKIDYVHYEDTDDELDSDDE